MKKFFSIIISLILVFSVVTVSADVPAAFKKIYTNYSCDYSFSMSFENSDELVALLEAIEMPDEINNYIDVNALLDSALSKDVEMTVQADISEDFKRAEMGLVAYSKQPLNVNANLSMDINSKFGVWIKLDLVAQEPVFNIVYAAPVLNRYMVIDVFAMIEEEYEKENILVILNSFFNKDYMTDVMSYSVELIEKYADIKTSGSRCTMKIDNDGIVAMLNDITKYAYDLSYEKLQPFMDEEADAGISMEPYEEIFPFANIQLLGEGGITAKYTLNAAGISTADVDVDIAINVKDIYEAVMGMEWGYETEGVLKFRVKEAGNVTKIGKTKVDFPVLTEENSFNYADLYADNNQYNYEEYEPTYPNYYVSCYTDCLPIVDGKIYVPLRQVVERAYDDTADIDYNNGVITLTSEYFDKIVLTVGSDRLYTKGAYQTTDKVLKIENTVYVSASFFEEVFGWYFATANHMLLDDTYFFCFYTH